MQRSIATVSLGGTFIEKLSAIAAAGFDGVEIFENDLMYLDGTPADARRIADDLVKKATEKNLDGAALAYVEMTLTCVKCHKHVREARKGAD